jgi:hypothetical protein
MGTRPGHNIAEGAPFAVKRPLNADRPLELNETEMRL